MQTHICYVCVCPCVLLSASACLFFYIKEAQHHVSMWLRDDKSPLTIYSHTALHNVTVAMFPSLSDTQASSLPVKLPPLPKWSSHFQGERLHGITYFVLGITFSLPVWLSRMDMAGWL